MDLTLLSNKPALLKRIVGFPMLLTTLACRVRTYSVVSTLCILSGHKEGTGLSTCLTRLA
jgi:hypothetical protein